LKQCFKNLGLGECSDQMVAQYSGINNRWWEILERGEMSKPEILVGRFTEFLKARNLDFRLASKLNEMYQSTLGDYVCFMPFALETVQTLRGKVFQAVVSNGTITAQTKKLKNSHLDQVFDAVFLSEQVGHEKPSRLFFDKVFEELSVKDKTRVIVIGDSLTSDIKGANDSGCFSCWYNPNHMKNTRGILPDIEIDDLRKVIDIVL